MNSIRRFRAVTAASAFIGLSFTAGSGSADIVHADDVIIVGSSCVGTECEEFESFAFDTLRLKEANMRIHFDDTSLSDLFPQNDWRILVNDTAIDGDDYFAIEDDTADTVPFRIDAGALTDSLRVLSDGNVNVDNSLGIGTATPAADLEISNGSSPAIRLNQDGSNGGIFTPQVWALSANHAVFNINDVTNGTFPVQIDAGAPTSSLDIDATGRVVVEGDFSAGSSREIKHAFAPVEPGAILARLVELPVNEWSYRTDQIGIRHLGPVAEEFHAAFALGRDDRHVSPVDLAGVAFAAIQGLHEVLSAREAEIEELRKSRDELAARIEALERPEERPASLRRSRFGW